MKKSLPLAVAVLATAVAAACGSGHSKAYDAGYKWASDYAANQHDLAQMQVSMLGAGMLCSGFATEEAGGLDQQQWHQGCRDALNAKLGGTK
jgi:hypothetical protein